MSDYIDITEIYLDLKELACIESNYDRIPSLMQEGMNMDITKAVLEYKKKYKEENKEYKEALKQKKYNEATRHANNMKQIAVNMKRSINKIDTLNSFESVIGTCLSVVLSCLEFIVPSLLLASKFAIKKIPVAGGIIVAGINAGQKYAGVEDETKQIVDQTKETITDIKSYQKKSEVSFDHVNGYKVKMVNYCTQLERNADYLVKMVKVNKILDS